MTSLDFELEISPVIGGVYPVVARASGSEVAASVRLPMSPPELDHQLGEIRKAVLASSARLRSVPTPEEKPVRELGQRLFETFVADEVRTLYMASRQRAREQASTLRLVLRVRPPELARLPWEFLFDPSLQDYPSVIVPLVRYPTVLVTQQPLKVPAPLRILGMVVCPHDRNALDVGDEKRRLETALDRVQRDGLVALSWVDGQTYNDLEEHLERDHYHVFHFVGHGDYRRITEEGALAFANEDGSTHLVGANDVSILLAEHHTLRLVVLNACDTARGSASDALSSTAGTLVRRGIPAVVAMQFEISDPAAILFSQTFYKKVAKRRPVDAAVMHARRVMRSPPSDTLPPDTLEWGTPVLYLHAPDGHIFGTETDPPTQLGPPPAVAVPDVEALYTQALAAYWSKQLDRAVALLSQVISHCPDHSEANAKLKETRLQQRYAQACSAAVAQKWEQAVEGFESIAGSDPTYRDVTKRLTDARLRLRIAVLYAEARRLHQAGQWTALLEVGKRLETLDPAAADPDGLVTSARAELASAEKEQLIAARFHNGVHLLEAHEWQQAVDEFSRVMELDPTYRNTQELLATALRELRRAVRDPDMMWVLHHPKTVYAVAFSPDGNQLATACDDRIARVWDFTSGQELLSLLHKRWSSGVLGVVFSPDGRWLATASRDRTARIWDATTGQELVKVAHSDWVQGVAFSPDGYRLATASADRTARIWDATSGQELVKVAHSDWVQEVVFSPDGRRLATASADRTARIWDTTSGDALATVTHDKPVDGVVFSPDGSRLATVGADKTARIWALDRASDDE